MTQASVFQVIRGAMPKKLIEDAASAAHSFFAYSDTFRWPGQMGDIARLQNGVALTKINADVSWEVEELRQLIDEAVFLLGIAYEPEPRAGLRAIYDCTSVRRQHAVGGTPLPWHQDACPMGTENPGDGLVFWIPLTEIDDTTPSLEFMPQRGVLPHGSRKSFSALLSEPVGEIIRCPDMKIGDVLMFGLDIIHRTYIPAAATRVRYSCDLRVGSPEYLGRHPEYEVMSCG